MSKATNLVKLVQSISTQGVLSPAAIQGGGGGYINLSMVGVLVPPYTGVSRFYSPTNVTISNVYANLANSADGSVIFTLKKNGTTIGTTFTIPSGTVVMTPVVINVSLTTTDYLTLDVTGTATTARDLYVRLKYS
jgi:hypothetical protein